jgi:hypothetical protein
MQRIAQLAVALKLAMRDDLDASEIVCNVVWLQDTCSYVVWAGENSMPSQAMNASRVAQPD